jgi:hypothetical protein
MSVISMIMSVSGKGPFVSMIMTVAVGAQLGSLLVATSACARAPEPVGQSGYGVAEL